MVTLVDGRQVPSDSEEWRLECEARAVLAMPNIEDRRNYLDGKPDPVRGFRRGGVIRRRGQQHTDMLKEKIRELWRLRR